MLLYKFAFQKKEKEKRAYVGIRYVISTLAGFGHPHNRMTYSEAGGSGAGCGPFRVSMAPEPSSFMGLLNSSWAPPHASTLPKGFSSEMNKGVSSSSQPVITAGLFSMRPTSLFVPKQPDDNQNRGAS